MAKAPVGQQSYGSSTGKPRMCPGPVNWRYAAATHQMIDSRKKRRSHNHWLVLIAFYKVAQGLLFIAIGIGALHLLHKDVEDVFVALADRLRFNPEARLIHFILARASLLNDPLLRRIGAAAFCYAGISFAEGIGLYMEKTWGELLTLFITASFLPWEMIEIAHKMNLVRISLLTINTIVVFYLINLIAQEKRRKPTLKKTA
jgi:uncharacterized membrane protein (DUF2068 family)